MGGDLDAWREGFVRRLRMAAVTVALPGRPTATRLTEKTQITGVVRDGGEPRM